MSFAKRAARLAARYRVTSGRRFRLPDVDPADTGGFPSEARDEAKDLLAEGVTWLAGQQEKLYAQDRWAILVILQAMDAAGKDSVIKHVMSGLNPQGCYVRPFKVPSAEELDHDYLWRAARVLPERGQIGIFNRSYYEEVLVVRVHRELLDHERLPEEPGNDRIWAQRFEDITAFERYLGHNGIVVRKFFLHVSQAEQRRRFLARLDDPAKRWKFSLQDVHERAHWNAYMAAYEDMIRHTATPDAPWFVVPADHKWFTRLVVAAALVDTLSGLDLAFPRLDPSREKELRAARAALLRERGR